MGDGPAPTLRRQHVLPPTPPPACAAAVAAHAHAHCGCGIARLAAACWCCDAADGTEECAVARRHCLAAALLLWRRTRTLNSIIESAPEPSVSASWKIVSRRSRSSSGERRRGAAASAAAAASSCASISEKYCAPNSHMSAGCERSTSRVKALSTDGNSFGTLYCLPYLEPVMVSCGVQGACATVRRREERDASVRAGAAAAVAGKAKRTNKN